MNVPGVALVGFFSLTRPPVLLSDLDVDLVGDWLFPRALQTQVGDTQLTSCYIGCWRPRLCSLPGLRKFRQSCHCCAAMLPRLRFARTSGSGPLALSRSWWKLRHSCAHWRWATVHECSKALERMIESFRASWDPNFGQRARDTTRPSSSTSAFVTGWLDGFAMSACGFMGAIATQNSSKTERVSSAD